MVGWLVVSSRGSLCNASDEWKQASLVVVMLPRKESEISRGKIKHNKVQLSKEMKKVIL